MFEINLRPFLHGDGTQASRFILWLIGFFAFLDLYSMQAVLPLVMQEFQASPVQAGATVGATVLAALAMSAAGLLLTLLPFLSWVILGLALSSTGVFICQSSTMSFIADSLSEGRSLATGLYNTCYYAGGTVGTGVAGLAYEGWGWGGSALSIGLIRGLAAGIALFGWRTPAVV